MSTDDFTAPPSFYREMAKDCRCCLECASPPCDGVCAGGMCDQYCRCDDYDDPAGGDDEEQP